MRVLLLLSFLVPLTATQAQWQRLDQPSSVNRIVPGSVPGHLFMANEYALFRSLDSGHFWQALALPPRVHNPNTGYARVSCTRSSSGAEILFLASDSVYRSIDGGKSWTSVLHTRLYRPTVVCSGDTVFCLTNNGDTLTAAYASTDAGMNWRLLPPAPQQSSVDYACVLDGTLYAAFEDSKSGKCVYRIDLSGPWEQMSPDGYIRNITRTNQGVIIIRDMDILFSPDGSSWTPFSTSSSFGRPFDIVTKGDTTLAYCDSGIYWGSISTLRLERTDLNLNNWRAQLAVDAKYFYIDTLGTLLRSSDGLQWQFMPMAGATAWASQLTAIPDTLFAGNDYELIRTGDGGNTWIGSGDGHGTLVADGARLYSPSPVSRWTGSDWTVLCDSAWAPYCAHGQYLYAAGPSESQHATELRSSDTGRTWQRLRIVPYFEYNTVDARVATDSALYEHISGAVTVVDGHVGHLEGRSRTEISTDHGETWSDFIECIPQAHVGNVLMLVKDGYLASREDASGAMHYTAIRNPSFVEPVPGGVVANSIDSLTGTHTLWFLPVSGSPQKIAEGDTLQAMHDFATDGKYAYLSTDFGIWRIALASLPMSVEERQQSITELRAYPVPSSGSIRLEVSAPNLKSRVTVFDVTGRTVTVPQRTEERAILLDCSALPAGVYTAQYQTDGTSQCARFVIRH